MAPLEYLNPDIGILRKWDEEVSPYTDVAASLRYLRLLKPCKAADFALLSAIFDKGSRQVKSFVCSFVSAKSPDPVTA
ncbi:hypothetical protein ACX64O_25485 [Pseudomonas fitomaticsae]